MRFRIRKEGGGHPEKGRSTKYMPSTILADGMHTIVFIARRATI